MNERTATRKPTRRRLTWVLLLTAATFGIEVGGGVVSRSLALLGDAGHMATDFTAVALALLASRLAEMPADPKRTYGYARLEVLAALANGLLLVALAGGLIVEASRRVADPSPVQARVMLSIAVVGLVANLAAAALLHGGVHDLNLRGVYLHVVGDTISSIAVVVGAIAIGLGGPTWIDPAITLGLVAMLVVSAVRLILESIDVLLEAVPRGIDLNEVRLRIRALQGVLDLHDLHVWSISSGIHALSSHIALDPTGCADPGAVLAEARGLLEREFAISHSTLQLEGTDYVGCRERHE